MMYLIICLIICVIILIVFNIFVLLRIKKTNSNYKNKSNFMTMDTPIGNCVIDGEDNNFDVKIFNGNNEYDFSVVNGQIYSISTNGKKETLVYKKEI